MIEIREVTFDGVKKRKFVYTVTDVTSDLRKYWTVSQRTSAEIDSYLAKGNTELKVKRIGAGVETRYSISPL